MIFIIPFVIGAIGLAVGAVGGGFAAHAAGEKNRQESKKHQKVNNELVVKYSNLQKQYYELEERSKAENIHLQEQLILSQIRGDALNVLVELQQQIIYLMVNIEKYPSFSAIDNLKKAISYTNLVLGKFDKIPIILPDDYVLRNLTRSFYSANDDKDRAYYFYLYGKILHEEGNYQDAIRGYNEAIKFDNANYLNHFHKSRLLIDLQKYEEALLAIEQAILIENNDAHVWGERALICSLLGDFISEAKSYQNALCIDPIYCQSCYEQGMFFEEEGNKNQAIRYYTQVIKLKPDFADAYQRRGLIYLQISNKIDSSEKVFHQNQGLQDLETAKSIFIKQEKIKNSIKDKSIR